MKTAIYAGSVVHARTRPVKHRLRYRVLNFLLDLDELPNLSQRLWLFGHNRAALFGFRDSDHGHGPAPLRAQIDDAVRAAGLDPTGGRVLAFCMPRVLGMVFNPLTVYFCHHADGRLQAVLYEVNNTFGQRHSYLIPVDPNADGPLRQTCEKQFYVSPFMDMDLTYHFKIALPEDAVTLAVEAHDRDGPMLFAVFTGRRQPLTDARLMLAFLAHPLLALRVLGGIHWEALKLWRKGMRLRTRPAPPAETMTLKVRENAA